MTWFRHRPTPTPEVATDLFHRLGLHGAEPHLGRAGQIRRQRGHATYSGLAVGFDEDALYLMRLDPGESAIRVAFSDIAEVVYATRRLGGIDGIYGWPALLGYKRWKVVSFSVELKSGDVKSSEVGVTDKVNPGVTTSHVVRAVLANAQTGMEFFRDLAAAANAAGVAIRQRPDDFTTF